MHEPREDAPTKTSTAPGARHGRLRLLALAAAAVIASAAQGQPTPPCSADLDWDGTVSGNDLGLLLGAWGHVVAAPTPDIDGNGIVDSQDMGALLGDWGGTGPGDLDGDGAVDGSDLGILMQSWGPRGAEAEADLDGDGVVTGSDLGILLNAWGECVQPAWADVLEWSPDPAVVQDARFLRGIRRTHLPWRVRDTASGIEMLLVPPGAFQMGCVVTWAGSNCGSNQLPAFPVTLTKPYYLGRYEVTQAQWTSVMGTNPSYFVNPNWEVSADQVPHRPVEMVSYGMIEEFLTMTGLRLPTEAEWEHACRAGTHTPAHSMPGQPSGTDDRALLSGIAWYQPEVNPTTPFTRPVGQKWPNALGFHDMLGNIAELCSGWFHPYAVDWQVDPLGPATGAFRVWRGGSMNSFPSIVISSARRTGYPATQNIAGGFRAARSP